MKAKDLLLRIIQKKPNLTTFHVAKLAYLFDLAFVQLTGKPSTELPYEWYYYGPWTPEIDKNLWDLQRTKKIAISHYTTAKNHECFLHTALEKNRPRVTAEAEKVLDYIISKFGSMSTDDLKDFVYSTPPMKKAQKKSLRFERLDLQAKGEIPDSLYDPETMEMLLDAETTDRRKYIPLENFLQKFHTQNA